MTAPDAQPPAEAPYAIPPIPELYWDGIQFYLPSKGDDGTDGYSVMYLADGGHWSYQGWTEAPSEDCPVVPVVAALAGTTTPTDEPPRYAAAVLLEQALRKVLDDNADDDAMALAEKLTHAVLNAEWRPVRALLASTRTAEESTP